MDATGNFFSQKGGVRAKREHMLKATLSWTESVSGKRNLLHKLKKNFDRISKESIL